MYVSKTFTKAKKSVLCAEYPSNELKIPYIQMENIFSQFINKFLKIELRGKNPNRGIRIWNFQEHQRNSMCNFRGLIKKEVEFQRVTKKK